MWPARRLDFISDTGLPLTGCAPTLLPYFLRHPLANLCPGGALTGGQAKTRQPQVPLWLPPVLGTEACPCRVTCPVGMRGAQEEKRINFQIV